jgi:hypothetical protein
MVEYIVKLFVEDEDCGWIISRNQKTVMTSVSKSTWQSSLCMYLFFYYLLDSSWLHSRRMESSSNRQER